LRFLADRADAPRGGDGWLAHARDEYASDSVKACTNTARILARILRDQKDAWG